MGRSDNRALRLGRIRFLNVLPLYYPLEAGIVPHEFSIVSGAPSQLNRLMAEGELDLGVVSSIEYARRPEQYFILPDFSISCRGAVMSVLLMSRVPVEELGGEMILAGTQSHTSVGLLKVLLKLKYGIEARIEPGNCTDALASDDPPKAFLVIGDEALRLRHHPLYPHRMDMGAAWEDWTGLPFVFAVWVARREAVEACDGRFDNALAVLAAAKKWGCANLDVICAEASRKGVLSIPELYDYYKRLYYDLNTEECAALERFYGCLAQIGELPEAPRLKIYSPPARVLRHREPCIGTHPLEGMVQ